MRRRAFIAGIGSAAAWPVVASGQPHPKMLRVGYSGILPRDAAHYAAFEKRMSELGCESAWNKDPVFGVIGIQSGPRG
jgi:hypothetical protein